MRILHLVGRSHLRGAEQVAIELAQELDQRGHRDRLLAVSAGHQGDRTPGLVPLVDDAAQRPATLLRAAVGLRRSLRRDPVDVVVAHGAAAALVSVLAAPRRGPRIVFQTILGLADQSFRGVQGLAWRLALRRIDAVVALTDELGDELRGLGFRGPVWAIPNGRRTDRFAGLDRPEAGRRLREELGVGPGVALVGLVGFLVAQKRPTRAVEVLAALRGLGTEAHLVVAGDGPLAADVAAAVTANGVAGHASLLGHRHDVAELLAGLDVLVLTSDDEGVPGIVVEAAMAGCPVVTFPTGGVADVVDDGTTGVVLAAADVGTMAAALAALLADPVGHAEMSAAARRRGGDFSLATIAGRYEERFLELLG